MGHRGCVFTSATPGASRRRRGGPARILAAPVLLALLTGCGDDGGSDATAVGATGMDAAVNGPPAAAGVDYQLGGAYPPPNGVEIVVRDRTEAPADGRYSICYVNAFQTQPGEMGDWPADLLVTDAAGDVVIDSGWPDEALLDTSDAGRRERIADVVGVWIDGCAADGFDAVELDNFDHFSRSDGELEAEDDLALASLLIERAHAAGLAVGQKNAVELAVEGAAAGFDFVITESCQVFDECARYTEVYGTAVIEIEYIEDGDAPFEEACDLRGDEISIVQRDRALSPRGADGYVFARCD